MATSRNLPPTVTKDGVGVVYDAAFVFTIHVDGKVAHTTNELLAHKISYVEEMIEALREQKGNLNHSGLQILKELDAAISIYERSDQ